MGAKRVAYSPGGNTPLPEKPDGVPGGNDRAASASDVLGGAGHKLSRAGQRWLNDDGRAPAIGLAGARPCIADLRDSPDGAVLFVSAGLANRFALPSAMTDRRYRVSSAYVQQGRLRALPGRRFSSPRPSMAGILH